MNASGFTEGGLVSTTTFWQISVPLVVASIIVPVTLSGLLIRILTEVAHSLYRRVLGLLLRVRAELNWIWFRWKRYRFSIVRREVKRTSTSATNTGTNAA